MQVEITNDVSTPKICFLSSTFFKWPVGGLFISPTEKVAVGDETHLSATDRTLLSPDPTRPVVPTIEASALIELDAESSHCRSDASGRAGATLEPLRTRLDTSIPASGRSPSSVRLVLSYCRDSEQCHCHVWLLESSASDCCC